MYLDPVFEFRGRYTQLKIKISKASPEFPPISVVGDIY